MSKSLQGNNILPKETDLKLCLLLSEYFDFVSKNLTSLSCSHSKEILKLSNNFKFSQSIFINEEHETIDLPDNWKNDLVDSLKKQISISKEIIMLLQHKVHPSTIKNFVNDWVKENFNSLYSLGTITSGFKCYDVSFDIDEAECSYFKLHFLNGSDTGNEEIKEMIVEAVEQKFNINCICDIEW